MTVVHHRHAPFDVYIGRPSEWGNPFSHKTGTTAEFQVATREEAIAKHRAWFLAQPSLVAKAKRELQGKVLGCWCAPKTCHGDVLSEVANTQQRFFAGIGSRSTPEPVLDRMRAIAGELERRGYTLRSGGAAKADTAFETGTADRDGVEIYLPWSEFNGHSSTRCTVSSAALDLAARFHPKWSACSPKARLLHGRNSYQILGEDLATPADFVVCWTSDGKATGGTGQALRIAEAYGIPVFNLYDPTAETRLFTWLDSGTLTSASAPVKAPPSSEVLGRRIVCIDTEYDARYTDLGVARLACLSYSFGLDSAKVVGPAEAVALWREWAADSGLTILGHSVHNDVAVLAQEHHRREFGEDCVPGFGPCWELAHRLYESDRIVDTEINQRLTHIRFGPHKAPVGLGELAGMLFGEDVSDTKSVPTEVRALLNAAVPYAEWPAELMARAPHRVLFGHYLETFGEDVSRWSADAIAYALDDVRLPWRVLEWQRQRWGREIPDAKMQTKSAWMLHLVSIPGWLADRERAANIRERYRDVIKHCDRTLVDCGILHVPGRKVTAKRGRLQAFIAEAFDGLPPLSKSTAKALTPEQIEALTPIERQDATGTDGKIVRAAIERHGPALTLADALGTADVGALCTATGAAALNAHVIYSSAVKRGKSAAKAGDHPVAVQCERIVETLLPVLTEAGLVEVDYPRTIKKARIADYIYAILGDETPLSKTAAETIHDPTPAQRHDNASTAAKTVRQAILHADGHPLNVTDAVEKAEDDGTDASERFNAWLVKSGQSELNAYAVRSKADKTITNFLDRLDASQRIRTNYVTCVDTGRTSSRGSGTGSGTLNIQQLPRDYDKPRHLHVRGCILPDPGWAFIVADYSQLELCALAHVLTQLVRWYAANPKRKAYAEHILKFEIDASYESSLSRAINNDQDCHVLMASVLRGFGESYEQTHELYERADKKKAAKEPLSRDEKQIIEDRQLCKPINFGYPGGLGERKFIDYAAGYGVSITLATAKRTKVAYMLAWPEMRLYFDHIGRLTADGNAVITQFYSGRERGDCWFTKACNGFFQSLAADGAKYAGQLLVKHAYRIPTSPMFGTRPSGFVHDEYLVNSPRDQAELALPEVERLMVEGMRRYIPDVKIKAPGKVLYERWGK